MSPKWEASDLRGQQQVRNDASGTYLAQHLHEVPVLVIACIEGRIMPEDPPVKHASLYGSVLPAAWSFMLALRARGLGSAWTTVYLMQEKEVAKALEIPDTVTQAVLIPVAYFKGKDFKPAKRLPVRDHIYWNTWGQRR